MPARPVARWRRRAPPSCCCWRPCDAGRRRRQCDGWPMRTLVVCTLLPSLLSLPLAHAAVQGGAAAQLTSRPAASQWDPTARQRPGRKAAPWSAQPRWGLRTPRVCDSGAQLVAVTLSRWQCKHQESEWSMLAPSDLSALCQLPQTPSVASLLTVLAAALGRLPARRGVQRSRHRVCTHIREEVAAQMKSLPAGCTCTTSFARAREVAQQHTSQLPRLRP